ncbi:MAG: type II secretion system protein GspD, partial [Candidatus Rifleibacteriota bacterium]
GKAKVLANPKLTVYANTTPTKMSGSGWFKEDIEKKDEKDIADDSGLAFVNVGQKIFYSTGQNLTTGQTNYDEVEASLKLLIRDMFVHNNDLKFSVFAKQQEPSFVRGTNGPPDILNRSIMTTLKIKDQETVVLGGLINRSESVTWGGVPILSKIPYLGRIFKTKNVNKVENELVILLTPKIMGSEIDLSGNKKFQEVPVPRRSDKLEKLHNIFQQIKSSHLPAEN